MKQFVITFIASLTVTSALAVAQQEPPLPPANPPESARQAPPDAQRPPDVTLTGCLIQGTGPTVFLLDNAKLSSTEPKEKGATYVLAGSGPDINFKTHLNHEVTVTGAAESKVAPMPMPGQKINEKDLPKLTAKSVTMIADKCTTASH